MSATMPSHAIWPFALFSEARSIRRDADELVRLFGPSALEAAERNAAQEDFGFLPTARAGHWDRVAKEIARRSRQGDTTAALGIAA